MRSKNRPSIDYIRQCFRYESGTLYWQKRPREHFATDQEWQRWNTRYAGTEAGSCLDSRGDKRHRIRVGNYDAYSHKIIWAFCNGEWLDCIDHKDRDSTNDRVENLRAATQSQNMANTRVRITNKSGYKGISWDKRRRRWYAKITVSGKQIFLGYFDDINLAVLTRKEAAREYFGEFAHE